MDRTLWRGLRRFLWVIAAVLLLQGLLRIILARDEFDWWFVAALFAGGVLAALGAAIASVGARRAHDPYVAPKDWGTPEVTVDVHFRADELRRAAYVGLGGRRTLQAALVGFLVGLGLIAVVATQGLRLGVVGFLVLLFFTLVLVGLSLAVLLMLFFTRLTARLAATDARLWRRRFRLRLHSIGYEVEPLEPTRTWKGFRASWAAIGRVRETEEFFILRPRLFAPSLRVFLPKRAFASPQDMELFRSLIRACVGDMRGGPRGQASGTASVTHSTHGSPPRRGSGSSSVRGASFGPAGAPLGALDAWKTRSRTSSTASDAASAPSSSMRPVEDATSPLALATAPPVPSSPSRKPSTAPVRPERPSSAPSPTSPARPARPSTKASTKSTKSAKKSATASKASVGSRRRRSTVPSASSARP